MRVKSYNFQSVIFSSIQKIQQYQIYHWMGNGTVYQYVYSVYIIGWVMVRSISMYTLYISLDG